MKALLDTNIIIHREASRVISQDIGILYRWLDRGKYTKCIHSITIDEIKKNSNKDTVDAFLVKMESYEVIEIPSPLQHEVISVSDKIDVTQNDRNDTLLLNEVFVGRVDILITEDKKIHKKASELGIENKVFSIEFGLATPRILFDMERFKRKTCFGIMQTSFPFFKHRPVIITAATNHEMVVGHATPAAPAFNANIPIAFPATFIKFAERETHMVTFVRPIERYTAEPALYKALAGKDIATICI